ncbi:hypothetical protein SAMN06295912_1099 [Sphingomonas laterariae]|uniref:Tetratricopeptide repeat-containing protein n=1 Tax=Edaphosphingomonas laterariae TaxID=861865 RepID=A0A239FF07_9SPHN|nr:hypothetical protein [Sphingomonas laterariae]SNS55345.1 hypothetical protein SAMN06295912_1099 [Sphingomonas laterariae]
MTDQAGDLPRDVTAARIAQEVTRISAAPDFARAPVMRRLLEFLVGETLAGRGDVLKAYAVAVDGLGRPDSFDPQTDSYPRVQVGRLRRMLDAFYAREGAAEGLRLHIPQGQYRVFFDVAGQAAPAESATAPVEPEALAALDTASPPPTSPPSPAPTPPYLFRLAAALLAVTVLALIVGALYLSRRDAAVPGPALTQPPVLSVASFDHAPGLAAVDEEAESILLDGLRRTWLVRVYDEEEAPGAPRPLTPASGTSPNGPPSYRLTGTVNAGATPQLVLQLTNSLTNQLLWTGEVDLPTDNAAMRAALAPIISELTQAYGVIATDERNVAGDRFAPGHRCILEFDRYRRDRTAPIHARLIDCLDRTLAHDPSHAMALAARSYVETDRKLFGFDPEAVGTRAASLALARKAVAADPFNAFAQIALARSAQYGAGCGLTVRSARRAIELNPYDANLIGIAGVMLMNCSEPDAEAVLLRAVKLDPDAPIATRTALVYATLGRDDIASARQMIDDLPPPTPLGQPVADLMRATVAASAGDIAGAKAAWARLERMDPATARDPNIMYDRMMLPRPYREKSLAALARAGLIPPTAPR